MCRYTFQQVYRHSLPSPAKQLWEHHLGTLPSESGYYVCAQIIFPPPTFVAAAAAAAKSLQSCPTPCDPIDGSPPGSSVPGILQARTLEWVAISFSNA